MKKVSVIVPVYNVEKYLRKCLDSLVNQTLKDIEIIVVNDGSPDNSQDIIDEYVEKYPKLVQSFIKKNGGQGSARNLGIEKAKGEFLSFIDSDDWIDKNMLEEMYNLAQKEKTDIVICDMTDHYSSYTETHNCTKFDSVYEVTPSASNKIFRKSVVKDLRFIEKVWYEDFNYTTKVCMMTDKISVISKDFYHCHCRDGSTMNNNNSLKNLDMITVLEDIKQYSKDNKKYDENLFSYLVYRHILTTSINRVQQQKSEDKKRVIKEFTKYCHENISNYKSLDFYKKENKKRKIIAFFNYNGLSAISNLILNVKSKLRKRG